MNYPDLRELPCLTETLGTTVNLVSVAPSCPILAWDYRSILATVPLTTDYAEALKQGAAPAAYARVMFLGVGGSGKSSLFDGLMNLPLRVAKSTALAETKTVKYQWVEAADVAEDAWKPYTEEDEIRGLASHSRQVMEGKRRGLNEEGTYIGNWETAPAVKIFDVTRRSTAFLKQFVADRKYAEKASQVLSEVSAQIFQRAMQQQNEQKMPGGDKCDVVMHIWDCGGQLVFLNIISAFLTSRTMFLIVFNASLDLNRAYREIWCHDGSTVLERKQNISHIQLMMQWMQLIHASLVVKDEKMKQSEASVSPEHATFVPKYPKMMLVGTHGDLMKQSEAAILRPLQSACEGKAFRDLIVQEVIVDNTTAGRGIKEDPGYKQIRRHIHDFALSLAVPTPLAWVSFRNVVQNTVVDCPFLSYGQVVTIAQECGIPENVVPSVLQFYHQLGVFLHYTNIKLLSSTIIANPKWLIQQLCKLLMPDGFQNRAQHLTNYYKWLEEKGILLERFYKEIWDDCGLVGGAQAFVDLLEHFDLAKEISQYPREIQQYEGHKYFVPCMLKARPNEEGSQEDSEKVSGQLLEAVQLAATLHIVFNTGYVPPGFFVRLAARMTSNEKCTPLLEREVYRNSITFQYMDIDEVTIAESTSLQSIHIDVARVAIRTHHISRFAESCLSFRRELITMCNEVLHWLPSVKFDLAFKCSCQKAATEHFTFLNSCVHWESRLFCKFHNQHKMSRHNTYWLPPPVQTGSYLHIEDSAPTKDEIENVSSEMTDVDAEVLAREMEMEYSIDEAKEDKKRHRNLAYSVIYDFADREGGTRYELAKFLRSAKFVDMSQRLLRGEMKAMSCVSPTPITTVPTNQPKKQDRPTLPLLLYFPTGGERLNIISEVGGHYTSLGLLLLNDHTGARINAIVREHRSALNINIEIFRLWLEDGKTPVTWATLVEFLKQVQQKELALKIESSLL